MVRAEIIHADNELPVACIEVDRNLQIVSSIQGGGTAPSEGGWNARGGAAVPEPVRQSPIPVAQLRLQRPARAESRLDDWDPAARERLRDRIRLTNSGDTLLLLDDDDLDHALLMVVDGPYGPQPSLAGVLTIGKVDAIRRSMPMASEVFQVDERGVFGRQRRALRGCRWLICSRTSTH